MRGVFVLCCTPVRYHDHGKYLVVVICDLWFPRLGSRSSKQIIVIMEGDLLEVDFISSYHQPIQVKQNLLVAVSNTS